MAGNNGLDNTGAESLIYPGGTTHQRTAVNAGTNDIVAEASQLIGRRIDDLQPEPIDAIFGALSTVRGLYNVPGSHFIYMVRDADVSGSSNFSPGSQSKVKKIVTFPSNVAETTIIRATVFTYQNPTYPTKVTTITEYEEEASFYMNAGQLNYDVNDSAQNSITPN